MFECLAATQEFSRIEALTRAANQQQRRASAAAAPPPAAAPVTAPAPAPEGLAAGAHPASQVTAEPAAAAAGVAFVGERAGAILGERGGRGEMRTKTLEPFPNRARVPAAPAPAPAPAVPHAGRAAVDAGSARRERRAEARAAESARAESARLRAEVALARERGPLGLAQLGLALSRPKADQRPALFAPREGQGARAATAPAPAAARGAGEPVPLTLRVPDSHALGRGAGAALVLPAGGLGHGAARDAAGGARARRLSDGGVSAWADVSRPHTPELVAMQAAAALEAGGRGGGRDRRGGRGSGERG